MVEKPAINPKILALATQVTAKRPKCVIDHIIEYGFITTQDLRDRYGYNHPPRAVRDVRECGIPLETYKVTGSDGRSIGAYRFGNPDNIEAHKLAGRKVFSKAFKEALIQVYESKCAISNEAYEERYLQIDHRIPYEVAGDRVADEQSPKEFMLLSGSAQRQKSWSCEHCPNLKGRKERQVCMTCYWAHPEAYLHMATQEVRSLHLVWMGKEETKNYDLISSQAKLAKKTVQEFIKTILQKTFR